MRLAWQVLQQNSAPQHLTTGSQWCKSKYAAVFIAPLIPKGEVHKVFGRPLAKHLRWRTSKKAHLTACASCISTRVYTKTLVTHNIAELCLLPIQVTLITYLELLWLSLTFAYGPLGHLA